MNDRPLVLYHGPACQDGFCSAKICTSCKKTRLLSEFKPRLRGKNGLNSICRPCLRVVDAACKRRKRKRKQMERETVRTNPFVSLSVAQLAYLAGIVDGEGNIGVNKQVPRKGVGRSIIYVPRICVTNTSQSLLCFMLAVTGTGTITTKADNVLSEKTCYQWTVSSRTAGDFAEAILPYLVVKRRQAEIIIELASRCRRRSWVEMPIEEQAKRLSLCEESRNLNGRRER